MRRQLLVLCVTILALASCDTHLDLFKPSFDETLVGVENQFGIQKAQEARELSVYPGLAGGHMAFAWLGGELPAECYDSDGDRCQVRIQLDALDGAIEFEGIRDVSVSSTATEDWAMRLPIFINLYAIEGGPAAAEGQPFTLSLSLRVNDSSAFFQAQGALVATEFNPE